MRYSNIHSARFLSRPNRFEALVELEGKITLVHVKNTGRCRELLVPGCRVYLVRSENPARKTRFDLVAVEKERPGDVPLLINMDSQLPNEAAAEWLAGGLFSNEAIIRREVVFGESRFDFYIEDQGEKSFLEVKGCTLEQEGIALFPDAPTERGVKHIRELIAARKAGFRALLLLVIQMKGVTVFRPNEKTHPAFGETLREAAAAGVEVLALDCRVTPDEVTIDAPVSVELGEGST